MPETTLILRRRCADPECGVEFKPRRPWQKYHSADCRKRQWDRVRASGRHEALACPHCGKPVVASVSLEKQILRLRPAFCEKERGSAHDDKKRPVASAK